MVKPLSRPYSRYSRDAALLLGNLIRRYRIERKLTVAEVAERAGVSRGLMQRIEKGDPSCSLGAAFEAAAIVGLPLFDADSHALASAVAANADFMVLLPKAVRLSRKPVSDDF